jgi:WD40 repeat protein
MAWPPGALAQTVPIVDRPERMVGLGQAEAVAFSPDGASVYVGCRNGLIFVVDVATGEIRHFGDRHWGDGSHKTFRLSPDGQTLYTINFRHSVGNNSQNSRKIWRVADESIVFQAAISTGVQGFFHPNQKATAFSPDSSQVLFIQSFVVGTTTYRALSTATGAQTLTFTTPQVGTATYSADGSKIVVTTNSSDLRIYVIDALTGLPLFSLPDPLPFEETVQFSAALPGLNEVLFVNNNRVPRRFSLDTNSFNDAITYTPFSDLSLLEMEVSPTGQEFFIASQHGFMSVYSVSAGGDPIRTLDVAPVAPSDLVKDYAWSPDGTLLAVARDNAGLSIHSAATGEELLYVPMLFSGGFALSQDGGTLVSLAEDISSADTDGRVNFLNVFETETFERFQTLRPEGLNSSGFRPVAISADGSRVATTFGSNDTSLVWDSITGAELFRRENLSEPLALSPNGTRVVFRDFIDSQNVLALYDVLSGQLTLSYPSAAVSAEFDFAPDGNAFAVRPSGGSSIQILDAHVVQTVHGVAATSPLEFGFSPDGSKFFIARGGTSRVVEVRNTSDASLIRNIGTVGFQTPPKNAALVGDFVVVSEAAEFTVPATGANEQFTRAFLTNVQTGQRLREFRRIEGPFFFSPDATKLYAVNRTTLEVWDTGLPPQQIDAALAIPLEIDVPQTISAGPFSSKLFSLDVATPGQHVLVEVIPSAEVRGFAGFGRLGGSPNAAFHDEKLIGRTVRGQFDFLVPNAAVGTHFFLVIPTDADLTGGTYDIRASVQDFYLSDVSPAQVGNGGLATLTVRGMPFGGVSAFQIPDAARGGRAQLFPTSQDIISASEAIAQFNFAGEAAGLRTLRADFDGAGSTRDLTDALELFDSAGGELSVSFDLAAIRTARRYLVPIEAENIGGSDLRAPLLAVTVNPAFPLKTRGMANFVNGGPVFVLGAPDAAPANVLKPGQSASPVVEFISSGSSQPTYQFAVERVLETSDPVDFNLFKQTMKPANVDQATWDAAFDIIAGQMGNTYAEFVDALGQRSERLRRRGPSAFPSDAATALALLAKEALNEPRAAIAGNLFDAGAGNDPVLVADVKARLLDGSAFVIGRTGNPPGRFIIDEVPDGDYELFVEGYFLETTPVVSIVGQQDVVDLRLFVRRAPQPEVLPDEPGGSSERLPAVASDDSGAAHLLAQREGRLWQAAFDGATWKNAAEAIPLQGFAPTLAYGADLAATPGEPALTALWQRRPGGGQPSILQGAVGRFETDGTVTWSDPMNLTSDARSDFLPEVAINGASDPVMVWLQRDELVADDADLYFGTFNPDAAVFSRSGDVAAEPLVLSPRLEAPAPRGGDELCEEINFAMGESLPKFIPIIGGKYGYSLDGEICGTLGCEPGVSGSVTLSLDFSDNLSGNGAINLSAALKTDEERCKFVFDNAQATLSVGANASFESPPIPIIVLGVPLGEANASAELGATLAGMMEWKSNFPGFPSGGNISLSGSASPEGSLELLGGGAGGTAGGTAEATVTYTPTSDLEISDFCLTLNGEIQLLWGFLSKAWEKSWGPCGGEEEERALPVSGRSVRARSRTLFAGRGVSAVPIEETLIDSVDPAFQGTGNVYEGNAFLSDTAANLFHEDRASLDTDSTGRMIGLWANDAGTYATLLGGDILASISTDGGSTWGTPASVDSGPIAFNKDAALVFDSNDQAFAIWSSAPSTGLTAASDINAILSAIENANIRFSRLNNGTGVWSAPANVASLTGRDEQPSVAADASGGLLAAWINDNGMGLADSIAVRAAFWNGSSWGSSQVVTTAAAAERPQPVYTTAGPMVVWAQDGDGDVNSPDDWTIFYSRFVSNAWTAPQSVFAEALEADAARQLLPTLPAAIGQGRLEVSIGRGLLPNPDPSCCEEEESVPSEPNPPLIPLAFLLEVARRVGPVVNSNDPNAKVVTPNRAPDGRIFLEDMLVYTVFFENQPSATAAAQEVFVTDQLDPNLDWSSFQPLEVAFGDVALPIEGADKSFSTATTYDDLGAGRELAVEIAGDFNEAAGRMSWTFRTVDPFTGDFPEEALAGFLPPNDATGRGEGHVTFAIRPLQTIDPEATTVIVNEAAIVFDTNAPIITNQTISTIRPNGLSHGIAIR